MAVKGSIISRVLKWISRGVLGLLFLLLTCTIVLHLPWVQSLITDKVSEYFAETTGGEISISGFYFSILNGITIKDLKITDPQDEQILKSHHIKLNPNLWSLLLGKSEIHQLELQGVSGRLTSEKGILNIQFIIDGFTANNREPKTTSKSDFSLTINQLSIHDVEFQYAAISDSIELDLLLRILEMRYFQLDSNTILCQNISSDGLDLGIYQESRPEPSDTFALPALDFGTGYQFKVNNIDLVDYNIAFHRGTVKETQEFDPSHLSVEQLQVDLKDLRISEDSVFANVNTITGRLGRFEINHLQAAISLGMTSAEVADLKLQTSGSSFNLDGTAYFANWESIPGSIEEISMGIDVTANLNHQDFDYFLKDSLSGVIKIIPNSQLELVGNYAPQTTTIDRLRLVAGESSWQGSGTFSNLGTQGVISWDQVEVTAVLEKELGELLPWQDINWPSPINCQIHTTGDQQQFEISSQINSAAGALKLSASGGLEEERIILVKSDITGQSLELGAILNQSWLGQVDFNLGASGQLGKTTTLDVSGTLPRLSVSENTIRDLRFNGHLNDENANLNLVISDSLYPVNLESNVKLTDQIEIKTNIELTNFHLGSLLKTGDDLKINTALLTEVSIPDQTTLISSIRADEILLYNKDLEFPIDSLSLQALISDDSISLVLSSEHLSTNIHSNYNIGDLSDAVTTLSGQYGKTLQEMGQTADGKIMKFGLQLTSDEPLILLNDQIENLSEFYLSGLFTGSEKSIEIQANAQGFSGYGFEADSLFTDIEVKHDEVNTNFTMTNLYYDSLDLGDLQFRFHNLDSSALHSQFTVRRDTMTILGINSNIQSGPAQLSVFIDSLITFNRRIKVNPDNPIKLSPGNIQFDQFTVGSAASGIKLDGDLNQLELLLDNVDLTQFNTLLSSDSSLITHGKLDAQFSFIRTENDVNIKARIDSLTVADSPAINIISNASTKNGRIPFSFILNSSTNNIEVEGNYEIALSSVNSRATVDIQELRMFEFLLADRFEQISGEASGQLDITGSLKAPKIKGDLALRNVDLVTSKPKSRFYIKDEELSFSHSGLVLNDFLIYDSQLNPLTLDGSLLTNDYQSFTYDLEVKTDNYILIDNPRKEPFVLQGILVVGSDLKVSGNERDTKIGANIVVKDTTSLTLVMPQEDLELLSNQGIVEYVDPNEPDTTSITESQSFYDSLIATLPEFKLSAQLGLEEQAKLQIVVNSKSGDFIEAQGRAKLNSEIDGQGEVFLEGDYTISNGFYQLSFYDLVKKRFTIAKGSSIRWSGDPKKGELDFKALYAINSSSVGLIGHEISESEREIYRRSLPYQVGIVIGGTLDQPEIAFDLDLPQDDKISFPVLANKLERLRQPEFESELNKQVFGLLVLGGFIPETSVGDFDQSLIASTALSNSVNSILASQLNRMAGQLVKGVDVNVGLQSYSDFSGGGSSGQTRTAMDFRLSKSMMDDRLSIEVGGGVDIDSDQSGSNTGADNFRGDITVIYDLTEAGDKRLKLFNNETYDIIYHEIRNTGISLIFIKDFDREEKSPDP